MKSLKKKDGFSLVELMVVIVILGILAAIAVPSFIGYLERSQVTTMHTDATQLATNINTYNLTLRDPMTDVGFPPSGLESSLADKNLLPQLTGDFDVVIKYVIYDPNTRLFKAMPENDIRREMNGG